MSGFRREPVEYDPPTMSASDPRHDLEQIVRRVVGRLLAGEPPVVRTPGVAVSPPGLRPGEAMLPAGTTAWRTADDLGSGARGSAERLTPLAEELAWERQDRARPSPESLPIAIACDHGGFAYKADVAAELTRRGHALLDLGTHSDAAVDYPDFAHAAALAVAEGRARYAVVLDGAGIGSAMVANKVPGILAANGSSVALAKNAREHNHANVLTLGVGQIGRGEAIEILRAFLDTPAGPGRHARRVAKIHALAGRYVRAGRGTVPAGH